MVFQRKDIFLKSRKQRLKMDEVSILDGWENLSDEKKLERLDKEAKNNV